MIIFKALIIGLVIASFGYSVYLKVHLNRIDSKISGHIGWHKGRSEHKSQVS